MSCRLRSSLSTTRIVFGIAARVGALSHQSYSMFDSLVKRSRFTLCNNLFDELTILNCLDTGMVPWPADRDCLSKNPLSDLSFQSLCHSQCHSRIDSLERGPTPANAVAENLQQGRFWRSVSTTFWGALLCLSQRVSIDRIMNRLSGDGPLVVGNWKGVFSRYPKNKLAHGLKRKSLRESLSNMPVRVISF